MSTLKADTIVASDGSSPVTLTKQQAAKAFLEASASAVLNVSFNISSGTDHGTGDYSYAVINSFSTQYTVQVGCSRTSAFDKSWNCNNSRRTSSVLALEIGDPVQQAMDDVAHIITAHGDLA